MGILIDQVSKQFGSFRALDSVSLDVKEGSLVALLGPSGSGKSTLLRMIAGLEELDAGAIFLNGQDLTHVNVRKRNIGFVFQHYALFKHLTLRENIAFGLKIRKRSSAEVKRRVDTLLEVVQLEGLGNRYPSQISGGQRQRVALARALAVEPKVLLLDEPFGALDAKVRKELRAWLRCLHDEFHITTVFVTHDQEEAMEVSDEVVVMNRGCIEQIGTAQQIYEHPATPFVMSFIGAVNELPSNACLFGDKGLGQMDCKCFVRPRDIEVHIYPNDTTISACIERIIHLGWEIQTELILEDGQSVTAHLTREQFAEHGLQPGHKVFIRSKYTKSFPIQEQTQEQTQEQLCIA